MLSTWKTPRSLATASVALLAVAAQDDVRLGLASLAALALSGLAPSAVRWPLALMAGLEAAKAADSPLGAIASAAGVGLAIAACRASLRSWRVAAAAGAAAAVGLITRSFHQGDSALFAAVMIVTPLEDLADRWMQRAALAATLVLPAIAVARVERLLAQPQPPELALMRAAQLSQSIGYSSGEARAVDALAERRLLGGDAPGAWSALEEAPEPASTRTAMLRAEASVRLGRTAVARAILHRLAQRGSVVPADRLSKDTLDLWVRAQDRERPQVASDHPPGSVSFSNAMILLGFEGPTACVAQGSDLAVHWRWRVGTGFSPGENMWVFVHGDGPGPMLSFDHQAGGRAASTLRPGELLDDPWVGKVPTGAPPGIYRLHLGLYDPENKLRLHPSGEPGHVDFVEAGQVEVCP